ncbi:hypothetical protein EYF80_045799 [Liparis tanakae]|uniref:Uncharacterized protein n=1 Tax=Liparis tanakae TaxID=230148 RepID=A0A4Z2FSU6_9TELE|nr:hypothetical protein EYF80_045799 [Liparis tanakae]
MTCFMMIFLFLEKEPNSVIAPTPDRNEVFGKRRWTDCDTPVSPFPLKHDNKLDTPPPGLEPSVSVVPEINRTPAPPRLMAVFNSRSPKGVKPSEPTPPRDGGGLWKVFVSEPLEDAEGRPSRPPQSER